MQIFEFDAERFSRWMAYVLRHNPERYGLTPDKHGYVDVEEFLRVARSRYSGLDVNRLREFIATSGSARFELTSSQVRARYGHSIPAEPVGAPVEPPPVLYFGTDADRAADLLAAGLQPTDRRALHLSTTKDEAFSIARRKTDRPAVLRVLAQEAHRAGLAFYAERSLYLAEQIPPQFLQREPLSDPTPA